MALPLEASDEPNRAHINLYHRTATQADLSGKRVLEVSCGHGGGASYLMRILQPASYTGLDLNPAGIRFCQKRYNLLGLDFVQGNAEKLPFEDESFDVVLNVEASHCYPHFPRFLAEVVRVLRPGGYFPYADLRPSNEIAEWEAYLADTPLRQLSQKEINAEVLRGIEKNSQKSRDLVDCYLPAFLRFAVANTSACKARSYTATWQAGTPRTGCTASPRTEAASVPRPNTEPRTGRVVSPGEPSRARVRHRLVWRRPASPAS